MNPSLRADILNRLERDFGGKERGKYLQKIRCPDCDKREAYISTDAPWMLKCGRENNCGAQIHVKSLFPELFESWTKRYQPKENEPANPTAVADGYMRDGRGFDLDRVRGLYTQETFFSHKLNAGSTTVRFALPNGAYWERIIDNPKRFGKQKANFHGEYKGEWWSLWTDDDLAAAEEIWITEGIFDTIAVMHHGITAVAAMSCHNYPEAALARIAEKTNGTRPRLVWALDANRAGQKGMIKFARRAEACGWDVAAAHTGNAAHDWNDAHQRGELEPADIERYRYNGALLLAKTPTEKGALMHARTKRRELWFEFRNQLWWFSLEQKRLEQAMKSLAGSDDADESCLNDEELQEVVETAAKVHRICTAWPSALYYQANLITDESWYYYKVQFPHGGAPIKNTFSGGQLASASEFKKRLLGIAPGAVWTGSSQQLDTILQEQLNRIKTVETIDYIGYSSEHGAWLLGDVAVCGGKWLPSNAEDYFTLGRTRVKSLSKSAALDINTTREDYRTDWAANLYGAYGENGVVALAFWLGSLFAEQIRDRYKSYPFLEIVGEAGSGKSTLIEFLWKLCGRDDYEGFDPVKATMPARSRNFAQVSNLPVVLIESDRDQEGPKVKQFDWDELKTAFNGRSIRARGMKTSGNETYEPPFRGSIVIAQNAEVRASDAILSRICHLRFTKAGQTRETKLMAESLEAAPMEHLSGFILQATTREARLLELFNKNMPGCEEMIAADPDVRMLRIAKCHAQLLSLVICLGPSGLGLFDGHTIDLAALHVRQMARDRQQAINADHPFVEEFWEAFEFIQSQNGQLDHYNERGKEIAINLKQFEAACAEHKLFGLPPMRDLKRYLKSSKSRKFVEANRPVRSRIDLNQTTRRCWIFRKPDLESQPHD